MTIGRGKTNFKIMMAVLLLGQVPVLTGHAKLVDRSDRRDRSIFTIGRLWLNRLLKLDFPVRVGFCPFPFLSTIPPARPG